MFIFGREKLNRYSNHHTRATNNITTNALTASGCPNIWSNIHNNGQEIYPPSCSYELLCPSTIGKLINHEINTNPIVNDLSICLMRCHLNIINIPANTHKPKNIVNPTSPNAICAYFCINTNVGDPCAKKSVKKYSHHSAKSPDQSLYLLSTMLCEDFLLRATILCHKR